MSTDGRIEIEIAVEGADDASRRVQNFQRELDRTGQTATSASGGLGTLRTSLGGAAVAFTALASAGGAAVAAMVAFGNELERQAGVFNRFNGDIEAARRATNGLVSDLQLMQAANAFAARGIRIAGQDLRNVMVAALERSAATGRDFQQVLDQLTQALSTGSTEALQQFGISVQRTGDRSRDAQSAFQELERQYGNVESSADTAGGSVQRFQVALENSKTAFFEAINDTGNLDQAFTDLFNAVTGGSSTFEEAMDTMTSAARTMAAVVAEMIERTSGIVSAEIRGWRALLEGDWRGAMEAFGEGRAGRDDFVAALADGRIMDRASQRSQLAGQLATARRSNGPAQTTVTGGGRRRGGRRRESEAERERRQFEEQLERRLDQAEVGFWQAAMARIADATAEMEESGTILDPVTRARQDARAAIGQALGASDTAAAERRRAGQADVRRGMTRSGEDLGRFREFAGERAVGSGEQAERYRDALRQREDDHRAYIDTIRELEAQGTDWTAEEFQRRYELNREMLAMQRDDARAALQRTRQDAESILTPALSGITKATSEVIAGTKSADEAFQGMLSSFLEMISQHTALSAAKEFAEAIAAFARQDYPGGAQHLAAGAAFTAVAVAAGAASIAVAPPSGGAPAALQQTAPEGNQGGGNIVINWNSAVITAGTRAELGREIGSMLTATDRRFGTT